jgi:septation ring formation regulator EzrA
LIVDVRCSSQYSNPEDATGSESSRRLQALQKQKKQLESQIELVQSKENILRDVLVAYARNDKFEFGSGLDAYDERKLAVKTEKEDLSEELEVVEKKIQEIGIVNGYSSGHQVTGSTGRFSHC